MPGMDDLARTERIAWEVVEGRPADDAARAMCDVLGGCDAYASLVDIRTGRGLDRGFAYLDPALVDLLAREFSTPETSPLLRVFPFMRQDVFFHCSTILDMDHLRRTRFYADWWLPSGVRDHAGAILLPAPDGRLAYVTVGCLGDREWLDADELRYAEAACVGIARALRATASLAHGRASSTVEARAPDPCWLLGAGGQIHLANEPAAAIGLDDVVRRRNGRIALSDPGPEARLSALVDAVRKGGNGGSVLVHRQNGYARLTVEPGPAYREERTALVTLRAPSPMDWNASELEAAAGLTPREAEVAVALATGAGTGEIAEMCGVQIETVRIYLKRVYAKLGVGGQSELVAMLLQGRSWSD